MRGSERRIGEGQRLLGFDEDPFPVEPRAVAFMCLEGTRDVRGVVGVDVLGEAVEELGQIPGGLIGEIWEFEDQAVARGHVIGWICGIGHDVDCVLRVIGLLPPGGRCCALGRRSEVVPG